MKIDNKCRLLAEGLNILRTILIIVIVVCIIVVIAIDK